MLEELFSLLRRLGLGPASKPVCDLIVQLAGESMSLQFLQQEIHNVLAQYGRTHLSETVVSALVQLGLAGFSAGFDGERNEGEGVAAAAYAPRRGRSPISDSTLLTDAADAIAARPRTTKAVHEAARDWLDIDGGIYVDVRQHDLESDSEK